MFVLKSLQMGESIYLCCEVCSTINKHCNADLHPFQHKYVRASTHLCSHFNTNLNAHLYLLAPIGTHCSTMCMPFNINLYALRHKSVSFQCKPVRTSFSTNLYALICTLFNTNLRSLQHKLYALQNKSVHFNTNLRTSTQICTHFNTHLPTLRHNSVRSSTRCALQHKTVHFLNAITTNLYALQHNFLCVSTNLCVGTDLC